MSQGPGHPGPGPKLQDTHGECNYLLSGRLPTVRQTTYCQANYLLSKLGAVTHGESNYLLSGKATYCQACTQPLHRLAPNNRILAPKSFRILCTQQRIHAPNRSTDHHPKSAYMHQSLSAYMKPQTPSKNKISSAYMHCIPKHSIDSHISHIHPLRYHALPT